MLFLVAYLLYNVYKPFSSTKLAKRGQSRVKIAGIVAEYDPFHAGHAWMIDEVRRAGFEAVVCVMSPSVVQRGGAAAFPVDVRTRAALAGGADLVLCLPAP